MEYVYVVQYSTFLCNVYGVSQCLSCLCTFFVSNCIASIVNRPLLGLPYIALHIFSFPCKGISQAMFITSSTELHIYGIIDARLTFLI